MIVQLPNIFKGMLFGLLCMAFSPDAAAQDYLVFSPGGYATQTIISPYVAAIPAPYPRAVAVARYPVATVQVVAPAPVIAPISYYTVPPVLVRPVVVRPKYYVPFQPVRNTVRAFTP